MGRVLSPLTNSTHHISRCCCSRLRHSTLNLSRESRNRYQLGQVVIDSTFFDDEWMVTDAQQAGHVKCFRGIGDIDDYDESVAIRFSANKPRMKSDEGVSNEQAAPLRLGVAESSRFARCSREFVDPGYLFVRLAGTLQNDLRVDRESTVARISVFR
jgi:hypothetical protein